MPSQNHHAAAAAGAAAPKKNEPLAGHSERPFIPETGANSTAKSLAFQGLGRTFPPLEATDPTFDLSANDADESIGAMLESVPGCVRLASISDVDSAPIRWLWRYWLAKGKVHILAGCPGTGKTTLACAMTAAVTSAGYWPDGTDAYPGKVLFISSEDDIADTLRPRMEAAGANLDHVHFIVSVNDEFGNPRPFDPFTDLINLERELQILRPALIVIDPIVSFVGGDSHKNTEVRRDLQPLVDMAMRLDCAILGITHLGKGSNGRDPAERVIGSIAFTAVARVVMLATKNGDPAADFPRMLVRAKSNIGPDDGGFGYDLQNCEIRNGISTSRVIWGNKLDGNARELISKAEAIIDDYKDGGSLEDACDFLRSLLEDAPMPAKMVRSEADGAGYSWATIRRAKERLGVEARKIGGEFGGKGATWMWALGPQDAQGSHKMLT